MILTKHAALAIHSHTDGVLVERHSWIGNRTKRAPDAVTVACYGDDELKPLAEALLAEHEERAARKAKP